MCTPPMRSCLPRPTRFRPHGQAHGRAAADRNRRGIAQAQRMAVPPDDELPQPPHNPAGKGKIALGRGRSPSRADRTLRCCEAGSPRRKVATNGAHASSCCRGGDHRPAMWSARPLLAFDNRGCKLPGIRRVEDQSHAPWCIRRCDHPYFPSRGS